MYMIGGLHLAAASIQGVLVKQILRHPVVASIHLGKIGDVVTNLLDGLHLLIQVVSLQEVTKLLDKTIDGMLGHLIH